MITVDNVIGLVLLFLATGLVFIYSLPQRTRSLRTLRIIPAIGRLRRALGLSIEEGKRIHVSVGRVSVLDRNSASSFVGLSTLERIGSLAMISDRPPIGTSGDGTLSILSKDTLRSTYRAGNAIELYDPAQARLTGPTPFSYVAGAIPIIRDENISTNIFIGNFGPEVALMTEAANQEGAYSLAASNSLPAQAVMFATAEDFLIGEELFALPAYLQAGAIHQASLRAQDVLRWLLVIALIAGAIIKLLAGMFGINFL